jgi:hypothetical protein
MPQQQKSNSPLPFFAMIGATMAALKLKERWSDYKQVSQDEPGRVALPTSDRDDNDEEAVSLLDTTLPGRHNRTRRKKDCCVCCGMNCGLFWKAFGIVVGLLVLWNAVKLIMWAVTPTPTGLEDMPAYSTSLGCLDAPHLYNGSEITFETVVSDKGDGAINIQGGAVGTITVLKGPAGLDKVRYEMTLRTDDEELLDQVSVNYHDGDSSMRVTLSTPEAARESSSCSRFDMKLYVPSNLRKFHLASHTATHIRFDSEADINLDTLFVTLFDTSGKNQLLPQTKVHAERLQLQIYSGWLVGDVSIVNSTKIDTQRGDARAYVNVEPTPYYSNGDVDIPTAELLTVTGRGRTDVIYTSNGGFKPRPINSDHISAGNGDMYLTYKKSEFSGLVKMKSQSYTATGLQKLSDSEIDGDWTNYVGDKEGAGRISISSRGWTGLYF